VADDYEHNLIDKMNSALTEDIQAILEKVLKVRFEPMLLSLKQGQEEMLIRQTAMGKRLESVEMGQKKQSKAIKKIQETIDVMINAFNREDIRLHKRVKRIEDRLGLPRFE
jgi:hypothetical protein